MNPARNTKNADSAAGSTPAAESTAVHGTVRWYVGVPIISNPFFLIDVASAAVIVWVLGSLCLMLGAWLLGDGFERATAVGSVVIAGYLGFGVLIAFSGIAFLLGNRYAALIKLESNGVYCENMRGAIKSLAKGFHWKPYPIEPIPHPFRSAVRTVDWRDVHAFQVISSMRTILLKGRRGGTIIKLFCPDLPTMHAAVEFIRARLGKAEE